MTLSQRASAAAAVVLAAAVAVAVEPAPTLAQDQSAPCSWGTDDVCFQERVCTQRGFTFKLWPFELGLGTCISWVDRTLYYKGAPETDDGSSGSTPDDPGTPPSAVHLPVG